MPPRLPWLVTLSLLVWVALLVIIERTRGRAAFLAAIPLTLAMGALLTVICLVVLLVGLGITQVIKNAGARWMGRRRSARQRRRSLQRERA